MEQLALELVASLGLSVETAYAVIRMVMAGTSIWSIIGIILASGGIIGIGYATLVYLIKRKLKEWSFKAVAAW
ncbi:circular bacteriocin, circularin A/uberolysin family [Paenibacillus sp. sptzw28]|uniref:circular bacteriocin, circularin A/uberolysin family n=1 Tax=Paenibacillus sp. sptzw28 TaxID=715179 RepID=UPI001C6ED3A5|nr:circular bacteriocin, circularin A/uberolysin family [Paenibacillus sp. sptzw28]QYR23005.1 circular bacteriocin, circularin A/uberolysin family [Paenibacillus sp. sptzw28]